jgi:hypothetical protein
MSLVALLTSFPTAIPTVLLVILLIYWLLSIIGLVDLGDNLEIHHGHDVDASGTHDAHLDHDGADLHSLAGYLVAMGLGGVPLSIVASLLVFFTWLFTALAQQYLLVLVPGDALKIGLGVGVMMLASGLSIPISARLVRPLRKLFVKHHARANSSLVGLQCKVMTQTVDEQFGRAEVQDTGVGLNIRVWAKTPNHLFKNSEAMILSYDEKTNQYEIVDLPR